MTRPLALAALLLSAAGITAQSPAPASPSPAAHPPRPKFATFDEAVIRPADTETKGRFIIMQGTHRFVGKYYTLKLLIAAAYDLNPREISGGPAWVEADHFDILAITPGDVRPTHYEQMTMLRTLLSDRFKLTFHREQKVFSIYQLELASGGPKIKLSTAPPDDPPALISTVYPQKIELPAHNATMHDFVSMMQRAMLDRPVVDKTGLTARYDFDLRWAPDETQFGGEVPVAPSDAPAAPLFTAIQEQLGLKLVATRGSVDTLIVDRAERPTAN
jgi:uncharacterized protein (TIGR03435 family)